MKRLKRIVIVVIIVFLSGVVLETGFRGWLAINGKDVITVLSADRVLEKSWFKPHPHLLYVFKPGISFQMNIFEYPRLTMDKQSRVSTNQYGFRSTLEYDVKNVYKPPDTLRIATIGGSTTMGVNNDDHVWPYIVGQTLSKRLPDKRIEILNEGIMGYTSIENLIDLESRVIDFDCDVYVLYLGINDLLFAKAPLNKYKTDYSHFRKTIYESLYASSAQLLPSCLLHLKTIRAFLQFIGVPDSRALISNNYTGQFRAAFNNITYRNNIEIGRRVRQTTIRNITSMIGVIRAQQPNALIVLSSFYGMVNNRTLNNLNTDFKFLASQFDLVFVDAARQLPQEEAMVYDQWHFTREGDRRLGELMADAIIENLADLDGTKYR